MPAASPPPSIARRLAGDGIQHRRAPCARLCCQPTVLRSIDVGLHAESQLAWPLRASRAQVYGPESSMTGICAEAIAYIKACDAGTA